MQNIYALIFGGVIAILGGLIGLGGAEYRLPVLVDFFKIRTLPAVIVNLVVSLITVIFSLIFRTGLITMNEIAANTNIILNLLAGSLIGAYLGVSLATKIDERSLKRIIVVFLLAIGMLMLGHHFITGIQALQIPVLLRLVLGFIIGILIGIISSMLGVAGGELIIPTIVIIFSQDIKIAGSLSLVISIPTILMGLWKYAQQHRLNDIKPYHTFIVWMVVGSIIGARIGSYLLQFVSSFYLYIFLAIILFVSALNMLYRDKRSTKVPLS